MLAYIFEIHYLVAIIYCIDYIRKIKSKNNIYIKEIIKKKNKTDFSQHFCTNVFTAVADLQVQCLQVCIYDVNNSVTLTIKRETMMLRFRDKIYYL